MRFPQKKKERAYIPTASMADIAFLLIVFFMVTTIFRVEKGIKVELPEATTTERLPRRNVARVWVNEAGDISIDDRFMEVSEVEIVMAEKLYANPDMLVQLKGDTDSKYGDIAWVLEELRKAKAIKVSLASKEER
jgi:biopolymer transport protein ExbD